MGNAAWRRGFMVLVTAGVLGSIAAYSPSATMGSTGLGAPELLMILLVALFIVPTVYGAYRAWKADEFGWVAGILVSWVVGLGWLVGLIYLLGPDRRFHRQPGAWQDRPGAGLR